MLIDRLILVTTIAYNIIMTYNTDIRVTYYVQLC